MMLMASTRRSVLLGLVCVASLGSWALSCGGEASPSSGTGGTIGAGAGGVAAGSSGAGVAGSSSGAGGLAGGPTGVAGTGGLAGAGDPTGRGGASSGPAGANGMGGGTGGGVSGVGGRGGAAGSTASTGGTGGGRPSTGTAPSTSVHDGQRGQDFNTGWKFNRGDVTNGQATTFNDSSWRGVTLPHDWSIELAFNSSSPGGSSGGYLDGGVGWYRKTFTLDQAASGKRILVTFDGVYMNSQVWINGTSLGTRPYGYSSFEYDITPNVTFGGSNVIAVRVNNNQPNSRFYSGSGIYRNVWLATLDPDPRPLERRVRLDPRGVGRLGDGVGEHRGPESVGGGRRRHGDGDRPRRPSGAVATSGDSASTTVAADATSTIAQSLTVASPQLWSLASPNRLPGEGRGQGRRRRRRHVRHPARDSGPRCSTRPPASR